MTTSLTFASFHWSTRLSWSAIIAGCVVALSLHLLLIMLGLSLGIALVNPQPAESDWPELSVAAGVAWSVSALISLWIGGWIAGRTGRRGPGNSGGLHGLLVWSVATVVSFAVLSSGGGLLIGGAAKVLGRGAAAAGQASAALIDVTLPAGLLASFVDEIQPAQGERERTEPGRPNRVQIRRELVSALQRVFKPGAGENTDTGARDALVQALVQAGHSQQEAETTVRRWETAYNEATVAAEAAAARAARRTAVVATWTAVAFAIGAFFAAWGGRCGAVRSARLDAAEPTDTTAPI